MIKSDIRLQIFFLFLKGQPQKGGKLNKTSVREIVNFILLKYDTEEKFYNFLFYCMFQKNALQIYLAEAKRKFKEVNVNDVVIFSNNAFHAEIEQYLLAIENIIPLKKESIGIYATQWAEELRTENAKRFKY